MNWSSYQQAIFDAVANSNDSLIIEAVAGSGKTTTIVECVRRVPVDKRVVFLAFNKAIQQTLATRVQASNAECLTLHALGLRAWTRFNCGSRAKVEGRKSWDLLKEVVPSYEQRKRLGGVPKLVSLAKQIGLVPDDAVQLEGQFLTESPSDASEGVGQPPASFVGQLFSDAQAVKLAELPDTTPDTQVAVVGLVEDSDQVWIDLMDEYDVDPDEVDISVCREVLRQSIKSSIHTIDFDDMLYMPVVAGVAFEPYDVVFVDEWQDTNGIQHEMIQRMLVKGGEAAAGLTGQSANSPTASRLIAVGDSNQAIYRFRGSSSECMTIAQERFGCKPLPLSISYRCPKAVVKHAQQWVKHIEATEDALEGLLVEYPAVWKMADFKASDVLLCRLTRPLVETAFRLIRSRIPCRVLGRDIGAGLLKLLDKLKLSDNAGAEIIAPSLLRYEERETEKLKRKQEWAKIGLLQDKIATLRLFADEVDKEAKPTVGQVRFEIQALFSDNHIGVLTLSTCHRAKGLEWPRVFILDADTLMPCPWASDSQSEQNIAYVAATRAQNELYYIRSIDLR